MNAPARWVSPPPECNAYPARAYRAHKLAAHDTYDRFVALCGATPIRVPGMDTVIRLAVRLDQGKTAEQAAAAEYVYRWHLALRSRVFGVPHLLGL